MKRLAAIMIVLIALIVMLIPVTALASGTGPQKPADSSGKKLTMMGSPDDPNEPQPDASNGVGAFSLSSVGPSSSLRNYRIMVMIEIIIPTAIIKIYQLVLPQPAFILIIVTARLLMMSG